MSFGDLTRLLADKWGALSADEKAEWTGKAATAKALIANSQETGGEDADEALAFIDDEESSSESEEDNEEQQ